MLGLVWCTLMSYRSAIQVNFGHMSRSPVQNVVSFLPNWLGWKTRLLQPSLSPAFAEFPCAYSWAIHVLLLSSLKHLCPPAGVSEVGFFFGGGWGGAPPNIFMAQHSCDWTGVGKEWVQWVWKVPFWVQKTRWLVDPPMWWQVDRQMHRRTDSDRWRDGRTCRCTDRCMFRRGYARWAL